MPMTIDHQPAPTTWPEMLAAYITEFWTTEQITEHAEGWAWRIEAMGPGGYSDAALGEAGTKWGARRQLKKQRDRMREFSKLGPMPPPPPQYPEWPRR